MGTGTVSEVMGLIDDHQIIISPVQSIQIQSVGESMGSGQIRMEQHIIVQSIRCDRIVHVIIFIGVPVFCQLLRAENQYTFVSILIIFHHR